MKAKSIFSVIAMVVIMVFSTNSLFAQNRSTIVGKSAMVSKDNKSWALEVNGKVVTGYDYKHFKSTDGAYFAVESKEGTWGVCDAAGNFIFKCQFAKVYINENIAMLYNTLDGPSKIYDCKTKTYVQAEQASPDAFDKNRDFNPEKMTKDKAIEQSKALSAQVPAYGKFEIRMKANSNRQELVVQGKVIHECQEFTIITDVEFFNKTKCWAFIVKNGGLYGTFAVAVDEKPSMVYQLFIPYEYTFMSADDQKGIVRCTTKSGVVHLRAWSGDHVK